MGIKGSATCTLNFGEDGHVSANSGARNGRHADHVPNDERSPYGSGYAGPGALHGRTGACIAYAKERIQSTPVWEMKNPDAKAVAIIQHPDVRRDLLWMKAYVKACRPELLCGLCSGYSRAFPAEKAKWVVLWNC